MRGDRPHQRTGLALRAQRRVDRPQRALPGRGGTRLHQAGRQSGPDLEGPVLADPSAGSATKMTSTSEMKLSLAPPVLPIPMTASRQSSWPGPYSPGRRPGRLLAPPRRAGRASRRSPAGPRPGPGRSGPVPRWRAARLGRRCAARRMPTACRGWRAGRRRRAGPAARPRCVAVRSRPRAMRGVADEVVGQGTGAAEDGGEAQPGDVVPAPRGPMPPCRARVVP